MHFFYGIEIFDSENIVFRLKMPKIWFCSHFVVGGTDMTTNAFLGGNPSKTFFVWYVSLLTKNYGVMVVKLRDKSREIFFLLMNTKKERFRKMFFFSLTHGFRKIAFPITPHTLIWSMIYFSKFERLLMTSGQSCHASRLQQFSHSNNYKSLYDGR